MSRGIPVGIHRFLWSLPGWLAAGVAGLAADRAGVPLGWILGPLVMSAIFSIAQRPPIAPVEARRFGQVIVGIAIGLNMTTEAALRLPFWLPIMIVSAVLSVFLALALSRILAQVARVDPATAYFAILPGGLSEMANIGAAHGARSEAISLSHALRVALAVILVPAFVVAIDGHDPIVLIADHSALDFPSILLLGVAAVTGAMLLRTARLANPWMLGALLAAGFLAGSSLVTGRLPMPLLWAGQYLIGISIGIRFRRDILRRLPRFALASIGTSLALGALLVGASFLLHLMSGVAYPSLILSMSPGGFAEMTLTAQSLSLDIALVTGFHFVRAFIVNSIAGALWNKFSR